MSPSRLCRLFLAAALLVAAALAGCPRPAAGATFELTIGDTLMEAKPFTIPDTPVAWYGYGSPDAHSANTPQDVERAETQVIALVETSLGLFVNVIYDKPGNIDGGTASIRINCTNSGCADAEIVLADDPHEVFTIDEHGIGENSWKWATCCTDGMSMGPLRGCFELEWQTYAHTGLTGTAVATADANNEAILNYAGTPGELIRFVACEDPNPTLLNLTMPGVELDPPFVPGKVGNYTYAGALTTASDTLTGSFERAQDVAVVTVNGRLVEGSSFEEPVHVGVNEIEIRVATETGAGHSSTTYDLTVTRPASPDASLASLGPEIADMCDLKPAFSPGETQYECNIRPAYSSNGVDTVANFVFAKGHPDQTVTGNTTVVAPPFNSAAVYPMTLEVTAPDGTTSQTYTVAVRRLGKNGKLKSLRLCTHSLSCDATLRDMHRAGAGGGIPAWARVCCPSDCTGPGHVFSRVYQGPWHMFASKSSVCRAAAMAGALDDELTVHVETDTSGYAGPFGPAALDGTCGGLLPAPVSEPSDLDGDEQGCFRVRREKPSHCSPAGGTARLVPDPAVPGRYTAVNLVKNDRYVIAWRPASPGACDDSLPLEVAVTPQNSRAVVLATATPVSDCLSGASQAGELYSSEWKAFKTEALVEAAGRPGELRLLAQHQWPADPEPADLTATGLPVLSLPLAETNGTATLRVTPEEPDAEVTVGNVTGTGTTECSMTTPEHAGGAAAHEAESAILLPPSSGGEPLDLACLCKSGDGSDTTGGTLDFWSAGSDSSLSLLSLLGCETMEPDFDPSITAYNCTAVSGDGAMRVRGLTTDPAAPHPTAEEDSPGDVRVMVASEDRSEISWYTVNVTVLGAPPHCDNAVVDLDMGELGLDCGGPCAPCFCPTDVVRATDIVRLVERDFDSASGRFETGFAGDDLRVAWSLDLAIFLDDANITTGGGVLEHFAPVVEFVPVGSNDASCRFTRTGAEADADGAYGLMLLTDDIVLRPELDDGYPAGCPAGDVIWVDMPWTQSLRECGWELSDEAVPGPDGDGKTYSQYQVQARVTVEKLGRVVRGVPLKMHIEYGFHLLVQMPNQVDTLCTALRVFGPVVNLPDVTHSVWNLDERRVDLNVFTSVQYPFELVPLDEAALGPALRLDGNSTRNPLNSADGWPVGLPDADGVPGLSLGDYFELVYASTPADGAADFGTPQTLPPTQCPTVETFPGGGLTQAQAVAAGACNQNWHVRAKPRAEWCDLDFDLTVRMAVRCRAGTEFDVRCITGTLPVQTVEVTLRLTGDNYCARVVEVASADAELGVYNPDHWGSPPPLLGPEVSYPGHSPAERVPLRLAVIGSLAGLEARVWPEAGVNLAASKVNRLYVASENTNDPDAADGTWQRLLYTRAASTDASAAYGPGARASGEACSTEPGAGPCEVVVSDDLALLDFAAGTGRELPALNPAAAGSRGAGLGRAWEGASRALVRVDNATLGEVALFELARFEFWVELALTYRDAPDQVEFKWQRVGAAGAEGRRAGAASEGGEAERRPPVTPVLGVASCAATVDFDASTLAPETGGALPPGVDDAHGGGEQPHDGRGTASSESGVTAVAGSPAGLAALAGVVLLSIGTVAVVSRRNRRRALEDTVRKAAGTVASNDTEAAGALVCDREGTTGQDSK